MNTVALENLKVINQYNNNYYLIADGNQLSLVEKDEYDPVNKLSSLEYPIYFTYHHLFNVLIDDKSIYYQQRKVLLENIDDTLYNLMDLITDFNEKETEENRILIDIVNNIDQRFDIVREQVTMKYCEKMMLIFDNMVEGFKEAGKYLYLRSRPYDVLYSDEEKDLVEIMFQGVDYLEDEDTGRIYSLDHQLIGKWNQDYDNIDWRDDECKNNHLKNQKLD